MSQITVVAANQINAVAPPGAGTVDVQVTTTSGQSLPKPVDQFTYGVQPMVASISPYHGPSTGGTIVTITGTGFTTATRVSFDEVDFPVNADASFTIVSDTQITAVSPPAVAGVASVLVTNSIGSSPPSKGGKFLYEATVDAISPASGPTSGGTVVTVTGSGFQAVVNGATVNVVQYVNFGDQISRITDFVIDSPTQLRVTMPPWAAETRDLQVDTVSGPSPASPGDLFTYTTP